MELRGYPSTPLFFLGRRENLANLLQSLENFAAKTSKKRSVNSRLTSKYAKTYTSFSGTDMVCTAEMAGGGGAIFQTLGEVQTISYSIHDEKTPVRCVGDMNPKAYVFGPRTIAGTIIFTVFDRHWAQKMHKKYLTSIDAWYAHALSDELPSINITVSMANEYGQKAKLALYGITFVNEGQTMSINDMYTENTYQFYAMDIDYIEPVDVATTGGTVKTTNTSGTVPADNTGSTNDKTSTSTSGTTTTEEEVKIDPNNETDESLDGKIKAAEAEIEECEDNITEARKKLTANPQEIGVTEYENIVADNQERIKDLKGQITGWEKQKEANQKAKEEAKAKEEEEKKKQETINTAQKEVDKLKAEKTEEENKIHAKYNSIAVELSRKLASKELSQDAYNEAVETEKANKQEELNAVTAKYEEKIATAEAKLNELKSGSDST